MRMRIDCSCARSGSLLSLWGCVTPSMVTLGTEQTFVPSWKREEAVPTNELSMPLLDHVLTVHGSMLRIGMTKTEIEDRLLAADIQFVSCFWVWS